MAVILPLLFVFSQVAVPHHAPVHHPYARPHHLRTVGPGPRLKAPAAAAPTQGDANEEAIEEVEAVVPVASDAATAGADASTDHLFGVVPDASAPLLTAAGAAGALGHLHAAVVHLPIAWVLLWAMVEMLSLVRPQSAFNGVALRLGLLTTLSYGPAVASGLCRLDELASNTKGYESAEALLHRNLIFASAILCLLCLLLRLINWRWPNMFCRLLGLMGVVAAAAITGYSAHLGGRMVYGADFLPF